MRHELQFCRFQSWSRCGEGNGSGLQTCTKDSKCTALVEAAMVGSRELVAVVITRRYGDEGANGRLSPLPLPRVGSSIY